MNRLYCQKCVRTEELSKKKVHKKPICKKCKSKMVVMDLQRSCDYSNDASPLKRKFDKAIDILNGGETIGISVFIHLASFIV